MNNIRTIGEDLKLSKEIVELAENLSKELKIGDAGVIAVGKDFYEQHLPEGLTIDVVKKVQEHDSNLISAAALAVGVSAIPHMKKHKTVDTVNLDINAVKNKIEMQFQRSKPVPAGLGGGEPSTKFGVMSVNYRVHAAKNVGSFGKVRKRLSDEAKTQLGG